MNYNSIIPTSPMQRAYFTGKNPQIPLGGVECAGYLEFRGKKLDLNRLHIALNKLSKSAVFNCRFVNREQIAVAEFCPVIRQFHVKDVDLNTHAAHIRETLFQNSINIAEGKMWDAAIFITETQTVLHFIFSLAVVDFQGMALFSRQLADFYNDCDVEISSDLLATYETVALDIYPKEANTFSSQENLPAPPEILSQNLSSTSHKINRYSHFYTQHQWTQFENVAKQYQVSSAALFLSLYSQALRQYSDNSAFIITLAGLRIKKSKHLLGMRTTAYLHRAATAANFSELVRQTHKDLRTRMRNNIEAPDEIRAYVSQHGHAGISPYVLTFAASQRIFDATTTETLGTPNCWGQTPQVVMDCQVFNLDGERIEIGLDVREGALDENIATDILRAICQQIDMLSTGQEPRSLLNLKTIQQRRALNSVATACEPDWLYASFRRQVLQQPNAPAIFFSSQDENNNAFVARFVNGEISYAQLDELARRVAAFLETKTSVDSVIGIRLPKGAAQIIAALGILYRGCTYLPLNAQIPEGRLQQICQSAKVAYVLTSEDFVDIFNVQPIAQPIQPTLDATKSLAYIIYTSGSTGKPKGVALTHYSALNTIFAVNQQHHVTAHDRVLAVSALEFDLSVYDIFGMLSCGGAIVTLNDEEQKDAFRWGDLVRQFQITIWNSVPALVEMLLVANDSLPSIRCYFCSGDWIRYDLFKRLQPVSPQAVLVAMGGATEAAIWSNSFVIRTPSDLDNPHLKVPYGMPLAGQQYRVVKVIENNGKIIAIDCADGMSGELWIGGVGVAAGYYRDADKTAQSFINVDSGETATSARWYRTGDMGCWDDGVLYFLGRSDSQVKINGYRVECGEVEQTLLQLPDIDNAIVVPIRQNSALGAIIVSDVELEPDALKTVLARSLSPYMIPDQFAFTQKLTLTSNGKVDRKWAQQFLTQQNTKTASDANNQEVSSILTYCRQAWQEVLQMEKIPDAANFFALGGDSLGATKVCALLRQQNIVVGVEKLFTHPTLVNFSGCCVFSEVENCCQINKVNTEADFPLTPLQRAYALGSDGVAGVIAQPTICSFIIQTPAQYAPQTWCDALNRLLQQSPALRLIRINESQKISPEKILTLKVLPEFCALDQYLQHAQPDAETAPTMEIAVQENHPLRIGLAVNYLCHDASSLLAIVEALMLEVAGEPQQLPRDIDAFYQYTQREVTHQINPTLLNDYPPPRLPLKTDCKSPIVPKSLTITLQQQDRILLEQHAKNERVTLTALLFHTFGQALLKTAQQSLLTLCLPVAYRPENSPSALGNFTQLQLCRCTADGSLQEINSALADVVSGKAPDFSQIAASGRASYPIVFTSTSGTAAEQLFTGTTRIVWAHTRTPGVLLDCQVCPFDDGLEIRWDYLDGVLDDDFIPHLEQQFIANLQKLSVIPQTPARYDTYAQQCIRALLAKNITPAADFVPVVDFWKKNYTAADFSDLAIKEDVAFLEQCLVGAIPILNLWEHPRLAPEAILHQVLTGESVYARFLNHLQALQSDWRCAVLGCGGGLIVQALQNYATAWNLNLQLYPLEPSVELAAKSRKRHVNPLSFEECPPVDCVFIPASLHRDKRIATLLQRCLQKNPHCLVFVIEITAFTAAMHLAALLDSTLIDEATQVQSTEQWLTFLAQMGISIEETHSLATLLYASGRAQQLTHQQISAHNIETFTHSDIYAQVAELWQKALTLVELPSVQDDFFQLGGDSLKATQIVGELRPLSGKLRLADLFNHSQLGDFVAFLERQHYTLAATKVEISKNQIFTLSTVQKAYLSGRSEEQILGGVAAHCYFEYQSSCELDIAKLNHALHLLTQRHQILQAGIMYQDDEPFGKFAAVAPPTLEICTDVRSKTATEVPNPCEQSPLVVRISPDKRTIGIGMDNLMLDGQSMWHILSELDLAYSGRPLPPLSHSIPNFASPMGLEPATVPPAPSLGYRQKITAVCSPHFARCFGDMDNATWTKVLQLARENQLTPASVLTAAYAIALAQQSSASDFSINLTTFMRPEGYQLALGDFTVLRLLPINGRDMSADFICFAKTIQKTLMEIQDSATDTITTARAIVRKTGNPVDGLFPVVLTCGLGLNRQQSIRTFSFGTLTYSCSQTPQVTLDLQAHDDEQGLHLSADYVTDLLSVDDIQQIIATLLTTLRQLTLSASPESLTERIAHLWRAHLNLASDSAPDNFFRDGGDSLRATRFIRELQQINSAISLRILIQNPDFNDFVIAIESLTQQTNDTEEGTL